MATNPATGQATSLWYCVQGASGELPANPTWKRFRFTSGAPTVTRDTLESAELDGTAERTAIRLGSFSVNSESAIELVHLQHDDLLAACMQSTWTAGTTVAGLSATVDPVAKTVTRAAGSFITDGVKVGDFIAFPGLTGYNHRPQFVTAVTATKVTFGAAIAKNALAGIDGLVAESAVSTSLVIGRQLKVGVARKQIAILTVYNDLVVGTPKYDLALDCECVASQLSVGVNAMVTGSFTFVGKYFAHDIALPAGSTFTGDTAQRPYSGIEGGTMYNNAVVSHVSSMEMTLDRGAEAVFDLGSKFASHVSYTKAKNSITASTFLYEGNPYLDAFFGELEQSLSVAVTDDDIGMAFSYPKVTCTAAAPDVTEGDIAINATFEAVKDSTAQSSLVLWSIG